jgi:hypothetical protein
MVYETDENLNPDLRKWGCAFLSLAHYQADLTDFELDSIAERCKAAGILDEEDAVQDWQKLVDVFGFNLVYRNGHFPDGTPIDSSTYLIGEWSFGNTTHFVVMDGHGVDKTNVSYDPIEGGSNTVAKGSFISYRIFDIISKEEEA